MKIRVRCAVACLFLISFASCHAVACVTADTDLGGGGYETSAAADPCSVGVQTGHGPLQAADPNVVPAREYLSTWAGWASFSGGRILGTLVLLLAANRVEITNIHQYAPGIGSTVSVAGANV